MLGSLAFYVISAILQTEVNPAVAEALYTLTRPALLCLFGGQLLINLKEAGERGENGGLSHASPSISDIQFA